MEMDELNVNDITNAINMLEEMSNAGRLLDKNELVQAYKMRGLLYMQTQCPAEAIDDYNKAYKMRGLLYMQTQCPAEAIDDYNKAHEIIEDMRNNNAPIDENANAEIYASRGMLYFMMGELSLAVRDLDTCMKIWTSLKSKGILIDEEMFETVREVKAGFTTFSDEDKSESIEFFNEGIGVGEKLKNTNQAYDKSGLANNYYYLALNHMQNENEDDAFVNLNKCIEAFLEIDRQQISDDDLKILSSAYMCRGEIYFRTDEDDKSLNDYNKAIAIEELLQKSGVEYDSFDILDIIRLYTGRARVLDYLNYTEKAINDFITALRLNKPVFDEFPDSQEDYYFYLDKLIDCLVEENVSKIRFNDILQEFLYPLVNVEKTSEAQEAQNAILGKL